MTDPVNVTDATQAVEALRYALEFASVKHSTYATALCELADSIEEQVKPTVEEPVAWGSLVRADSTASAQVRILFAYVPAPEEVADAGERKFSWYSEKDSWHSWQDLSRIEVLRIGVGAEDPDAASFTEGFDAACNEILKDLRKLRVNAITGERQDAYDKAIKAAVRQRDAR
jgi:hypothetical protein